MMMNRIAPALLAALAVLLAGYLLRSVPPRPAERASRNGALLPEVELAEPEPAPIIPEELGHAQPIALADGPEPVPAPLPQVAADADMVVPAQGLLLDRPLIDRGHVDTQPADPIGSAAPVLYADGAADMSLRNTDFPNTYIGAIEVDLTSPNHWVRLTWSGPQAARQETGPFHSSPGAGMGSNDCDDVAECNRVDSNCTPKGEFSVEAFSDYMNTSPNCRYVTWFSSSRGIALHSHSQVPNYPVSHGCVRLNSHAAQLIHNNSLIGKTKVTVGGTWTRWASF